MIQEAEGSIKHPLDMSRDSKKSTYLAGVYVINAKKTDKMDFIDDDPYEHVTELLQEGDKQSFYSTYLETNLQFDKEILEEAIKNDNYIKSECWINALYETYGDTILRKKRQNNITREMILEAIGKTEKILKKECQLTIYYRFSKNSIYECVS